ncbi:CHAT domain-containing protein [Nonomuraea sp. NPDC050790]|uniref:CHAT domain-containing protein n=1 Tax=Nonomuraea sp. NPDC050790 TaxID=3364371 RepID=UPI0037AB961A
MSADLEPLRPAFTMRAQEALDEAARRCGGRPMDTRALLTALMLLDTAADWQRLALDFGGIDKVSAASVADPAPAAGGRWAGVLVTATCATAIRAAVVLGEGSGMRPVPPGALALCLMGEPDTAAALALTQGASTTYAELLELAQETLLGGAWADVRAVLAESFARAAGDAEPTPRTPRKDEQADRAGLLASLASRLEAASSGARTPRVLDREAVVEARRLAKLVGGRYSCDAEAAMVLSMIHMQRYRMLPDEDDAWDHDQAMMWLRVIRRVDASLLPPPLAAMLEPAEGDVDLALLNVTAAGLAARFEASGDEAALDEAIRLWQYGLDTLPCDRTGPRAGFLSNLCGALAARADDRNDLADADEAVLAGRQALSIPPPDHAEYSTVSAHLGVALQHRFILGGDPEDLAESLSHGREAVAERFRSHEARPRFLGNLANSLRVSYQSSGLLADLDEAISCSRDAEALEEDEERRLVALTNLAGMLRARFERVWLRHDIDEAVHLGRRASALTPQGHPSLAGRLLNLSTSLQTRSSLGSATMGDCLSDADEAAEAARRAVAATQERHPLWVMCSAHLFVALYSRIMIKDFLGRSVPGERERDLSDVIEASYAAIRALPEEHQALPGYLNNLGLALRGRGHPGDLEEAVRLAGRSVEKTAADHYDRAAHLANLANAHADVYLATGRQEDLQAAYANWRMAATAKVGPAAPRLAAAISWGRRAASENDPVNAATGFAAAVELLPLVAWRGLERSAQEQQLALWDGVACDAAAWAIRDGRPRRAVELLEQGRSVLWAQKLHTRTDLSDLCAADPELGTALDAVRNALDASGSRLGVTTVPESAERTAMAARRLTEQWESLVEQVHDKPGFENFLRARPFEKLREAAARGVVVMVNTSTYGCDALVIDQETVRVVPLPELRHDDIVRQATDLHAAIAKRDDEGPAPIDRLLTHILDRLATSVVRPVLDHLGPGPQRVWWCPTGALALLPLHAAAPDHVISSYTATVGALIASPAPERDGKRILVVGVPETPGEHPLDVEEEIKRIGKHQTPVTMLQEDATRAQVSAALAAHPWVHFICHGTQDVTDPAKGAITLHDGPLPVLDIAELRLTGADFVYLSACHTFVGGLRLPDEAIHLAAAFQLAGYRHVIATLWTINDWLAPMMADWVYQEIDHSSDRAAEALHAAVAKLRARQPTHPHVWAPYVHVGP